MADTIQDEVNRLNRLQERGSFASAREAVDEIERVLNALPGKLAELRAGGYVFKNYFENQLSALTDQWQRQRPLATNEISRQQLALTGEIQSIQALHARQLMAGTALANLESKADAAERGLAAMWQGIRESVKNLEARVNDAVWTVNQMKSASFSLQAGEAAFEAVPANWKKPDDKDGVEGVLFLTDRRLIFEQREEVATKKVLFITTARQKLQSVQWELPVDAMVEAAASKRGFMNKDDFLTLSAKKGPVQTAELHLRGESGEAWQKMIEQVRSESINQERLGQPVNLQKWGTLQPVAVQAIEGVIGIRAAGQVRYTGSVDSAWLNSLVIQHITDLIGTLFSGRSLTELPTLQVELLAPLKQGLRDDLLAHSCTLQDLQIDLLQETVV